MSINTQDLIDRLASHAMTTGYFSRVNTHEPKNAPPSGDLQCAIWADRIEPADRMHGLASTTARVTFFVRVFSNMTQEPQDMIDPVVMAAVDALFEAYTGDFTLGGTIKMIDVLGASQRHPLMAEAGYISIDQKVYRVMTIRVPCIVNDAWTQAE